MTPEGWGLVAEPLWHVPAQSRLPGSGGGKRSGRQEPTGKDSPNRHSKVSRSLPRRPRKLQSFLTETLESNGVEPGKPGRQGDGQGGPRLSRQSDAQYSSHSSSNTLSSNASSNHSDERWFDVPDPVETEPDPFSKGGSSDSGIDTALYPCGPAGTGGGAGGGGIGPKPPRPTSQRDKVPKTPSASYAASQDDGVRPGDKKREPSPTLGAGSHGKSYRHKTGTPAASGTPGSSPDPFKQPR